jgi:hypothetical protein
MNEPDDRFGNGRIGAWLARLLDPYDGLKHLECDGFTRVASYVLTEAGIPHRCRAGTCVVGRRVVDPHLWIEAGGFRIDYRLRRWVGAQAPHGVFALDLPGVEYTGEAIELTVTRFLFDVLAEGQEGVHFGIGPSGYEWAAVLAPSGGEPVVMHGAAAGEIAVAELLRLVGQARG